jgi:hypothetical protein
MFNLNKANRNAITIIFILIGLIFVLTTVKSAYRPGPPNMTRTANPFVQFMRNMRRRRAPPSRNPPRPGPPRRPRFPWERR